MRIPPEHRKFGQALQEAWARSASLRRYTKDEVALFLEEDKLGEETAQQVRALIEREK